MPVPVTLPRLSWGAPHAPRHALLIHGLGSNGALMWRYGAWLADAGWHATAVDLRGHGTAPRALDYTIDAYASDVLHTAAPDGEPYIIMRVYGPEQPVLDGTYKLPQMLQIK